MTRKTPKRRKAPPAATGSVVKAAYRDRYEDGSCGDDLAVRLRRHVATADGTVDVAKLKRLAQLNDMWDNRYAALNAGLARMSIGNRLGALVRNGTKVKWR